MSTGRRASELEPRETSDKEPDERVSQAPLSGVRQGEKARGNGWTVADQFVRDGFRYRLMRRPLESPDEVPRLTRREEEALFHANNGCTNKRIAELLGVAPSTVGVLLFRAAAKLGAKSRPELLEAYRLLMERPPDNRK
jgi:DNA-binding CsgD family transcriptional regulator